MQYLRQIFTDKNGDIVIAQRPNLPIVIWLATIALRLIVTEASYKTTLDVVGTLALAIWAFLELVSGVNTFRKLLGLCVLIVIFTNAIT